MSDPLEFIGIEKGLESCNRDFISLPQDEMEDKKEIVEAITEKIIAGLKKDSPSFRKLFVDTLGGGSSYDGLKITVPEEFDIDILLKIPAVTRPVLIENNIPGHVNLQLENFSRLKSQDRQLFNDVSTFVDENGYILTKPMKNSFMQPIFDRTMSKHFPNGRIYLGRRKCYTISKIENSGPAFTLHIKGPDFKFSLDLVPCILLDNKCWPQGHFRENPFDQDDEPFFLVPKSPKRDIAHIERYWRLSFQMQERRMIHHKRLLKPTTKIVKRFRDNLKQKISSYAIKTLFLWKLAEDMPDLSSDEIPDFWMHNPPSYCMIFMLQRYSKCLAERRIKYFWNDNRNLIEDLTREECMAYKAQIDRIVYDIKHNPVPSVIIKHLDDRNRRSARNG